ncbi:hypothetical protein WJX72_007878 [[Myrmecia] bisecta]|uniref:RING-type domain-containing protein n=1 Tax=[Myrmecia] bisecta TaxID=41462 RepID=A0AAW1QB08_9CHLO
MGWAKGAVVFGLACGAYEAAVQSNFAPSSWGVASLHLWLSCIILQGFRNMTTWEKRHAAWGLLSVCAFACYLQHDKGFKGWADVYYFCGGELELCDCDFSWKAGAWVKAAVLWNFVLSAALGLQKLIVEVGMEGLLAGEEVVTKESFVSICWRLIPYWLNNWEQQWGAECSSMMFELPHFAVELLVVLPCVQIICARLKILGMRPGRGLAADAAAEGEEERRNLAPRILGGVWEHDPSQKHLFKRLRSNLKVLAVVVGIASLAAFNALYVPMQLESQIFQHPTTQLVHDALGADFIFTSSPASLLNLPQRWRLTQQQLASLDGLRSSYEARPCSKFDSLQWLLTKHREELAKMADPDHRELIPLVEAALALMRLSCEKFFVLISVFAAYLLYKDKVPRRARAMIRMTHRLSTFFQKSILYAFPAICWLYGAGIIFSTFVSVVFWGAPFQYMYETFRKRATIIRPTTLQDATQAEVERMNSLCAVCWGDLGVQAAPEDAHEPDSSLYSAVPASAIHQTASVQSSASLAASGVPRNTRGKALACGHAFHEECIHKWLVQCHGQGRTPTCPMCNRTIELQVIWRLPLPWRNGAARAERPAAPAQQQAGGPEPDMQALFGEIDPRLVAIDLDTSDDDDEDWNADEPLLEAADPDATPWIPRNPPAGPAQAQGHEAGGSRAGAAGSAGGPALRALEESVVDARLLERLRTLMSSEDAAVNRERFLQFAAAQAPGTPLHAEVMRMGRIMMPTDPQFAVRL